MEFLQEFLAMDMRTHFYRKFMENDLSFFEQHKSGELVSRLSSDVNQAKSAVSNNLTRMVRNAVIIVSNLAILLTLSRLLTLLLLLLPLYSLATLHYTARSKALLTHYQHVEAQISAFLTERFTGMQLIKACSTEEKEISAYASSIARGYEISKKRLLLEGLFDACSEALPYLGILLVLWYGGRMVIRGSCELSAGQLTSFIIYCSALANSTSSLATCYTKIANATHALQTVFQMLEYQPLVD
jgi:ATP-binding cassette subfamily B protein